MLSLLPTSAVAQCVVLSIMCTVLSVLLMLCAAVPVPRASLCAPVWGWCGQYWCVVARVQCYLHPGCGGWAYASGAPGISCHPVHLRKVPMVVDPRRTTSRVLSMLTPSGDASRSTMPVSVAMRIISRSSSDAGHRHVPVAAQHPGLRHDGLLLPGRV